MTDHPTPAPARTLSPDEITAEIEWAQQADHSIKVGMQAAENELWGVAKWCYEFLQRRSWGWLDCDTISEWLAQPEIGMRRTQFYRLAAVWEAFVVNGKVPVDRMRQLHTSKAAEVLPAIKAGRAVPKGTLDDIEVLGQRDLREKYGVVPSPGHDDDISPSADDDGAGRPTDQDDPAEGQDGALAGPGTASDEGRSMEFRVAAVELSSAYASGAAKPRLSHEIAGLAAEACAAYADWLEEGQDE